MGLTLRQRRIIRWEIRLPDIIIDDDENSKALHLPIQATNGDVVY